MKRLVYLLAIILVVVVASCNEKKEAKKEDVKQPEAVHIQRVFMGVELGKTNIEQAKRLFKGFETEFQDSLLMIKEPDFAGIRFTYGGIKFGENIAQDVFFMLFDRDAKNGLDFMFGDLAQRLSKKYGNTKKGNVEGDVTYTWGDDSTTVELMLIDKSAKLIRLWYKNMPLNSDDDL